MRAAVLVLVACARPVEVGSVAQAATASTLRPLRAAELCTTHGAIGTAPDGGLAIEHPEVRAVAAGSSAPEALLRFTYLGPSAETAPLSSGELRRQIGLKLRARDTCNVVYVMWRIEPKPGLVVSIKHNPGQRTFAECGAHGYRNIKPAQGIELPAPEPGVPHTLAAVQRGEELTVLVDGAPVWLGTLGPEALELDGPVGLRTDNGRFRFELLAPPEAAGTCGKGAKDS
jgi:hypothetical protein